MEGTEDLEDLMEIFVGEASDVKAQVNEWQKKTAKEYEVISRLQSQDHHLDRLIITISIFYRKLF